MINTITANGKRSNQNFLSPNMLQSKIITWLLATFVVVNVTTETIIIDTMEDLEGNPSFSTECRYVENYEDVTCYESQDIPPNPDPESIGFWVSICLLTSCMIKYTHSMQDQIVRNNEFTVKAYITNGQYLQVYKKTKLIGDHEYARIAGNNSWVERTLNLGELDEDTVLTFIMGWTSDKQFTMVDSIKIIVDNKPTTTSISSTRGTTISEGPTTTRETITTEEGSSTTPSSGNGFCEGIPTTCSLDDDCTGNGCCKSKWFCVRDDSPLGPDFDTHRVVTGICGKDPITGEQHFFNPDSSNPFGGICDRFRNLPQSIKDRYRGDKDCIDQCECHPVSICSAEYICYKGGVNTTFTCGPGEGFDRFEGCTSTCTAS